MLKFVGSRGVREERTDHKKLFFGSNVVKRFLTCPNHVQTVSKPYPNVSKRIQNVSKIASCPNVSKKTKKRVQPCPNRVQTCPNVSKSVQTCPNVSKRVQNNRFGPCPKCFGSVLQYKFWTRIGHFWPYDFAMIYRANFGHAKYFGRVLQG